MITGNYLTFFNVEMEDSKTYCFDRVIKIEL